MKGIKVLTVMILLFQTSVCSSTKDDGGENPVTAQPGPQDSENNGSGNGDTEVDAGIKYSRDTEHTENTDASGNTTVQTSTHTEGEVDCGDCCGGSVCDTAANCLTVSSCLSTASSCVIL